MWHLERMFAAVLAMLLTTGVTLPAPEDVALLEEVDDVVAPLVSVHPDVALLEEDVADYTPPSLEDIALLESLDEEPLPVLLVVYDEDLLEAL